MAPVAQETAAQEAVARGESLYRAGAYAQAAAVFSGLLAECPDDVTALRLLGLCRLRLGHTDAAIGLLERARLLAPDDAMVQLHLGFALHAAGRHLEAAVLFRACVTLLPADPAPPLNLAAASLAIGDIASALAAASEAERRAPQLAQAAYMRGMAHLAAGGLAAAEAAFRRALAAMPAFADAWVNLGLVQYRNGELAGATAAMRRALEAAPGHRAATGNLAAFLHLAGAGAEAEAMLRAALARDPHAAELRVNLAAMLLQAEHAEAAMALLDAVPAPDEPRLAGHWHAQRALALLQTGRAAAARAELDAIDPASPGLAPLLLWRRVLLAVAEGDRAGARAAAVRMQASIAANPPALPEQAIMAQFDLAKFWSTDGAPDRAFPHWIEGHRLLARVQPFSRAAHRAFVDASIAQFDAARLLDGPRAANGDASPVFILGMPRSGTTLTERIIAAHGLACGAGERDALSRTFQSLGGARYAPAAVARTAALDATSLDRAADTYLAGLRAEGAGAARVLDKMPGNFAWLGFAALMLPGARFIHCVRDPRDIGLSIFTFRFFGYHPYAHDLADLGWYIGEHNRLMAHWAAVLPGRILTVRLQDWVEDFNETLHRVLAFLGLPPDPACARFHELDGGVRTVSRSQVREPVNARGLGRWRAYRNHLGPLIAALDAAGALPAD